MRSRTRFSPKTIWREASDREVVKKPIRPRAAHVAGEVLSDGPNGGENRSLDSRLDPACVGSLYRFPKHPGHIDVAVGQILAANGGVNWSKQCIPLPWT